MHPRDTPSRNMPSRIPATVLLLTICFFLAASGASAEIGVRPAVTPATDPGFGPVPQLRFGALDKALLEAEDAEAQDGPLRFAISHPVSVSPDRDGLWDRTDDGKLRWRWRVSAAEATNLNFGFGRYRMPPKGQLLIYAADGLTALGPFTAENNQDHGELWTPILATTDAVLELTLPEAERGRLELELTAVNQGYRYFSNLGPDKSGSCNVDVVCSQGDPYRDIIRSVAVYSRNGTFACTGAMINNTAQNLRPFFLTANHCSVNSGNAATVVAYWLYENSTCRTPGSGASGGPGNGSLSSTLSGTTFRASHPPSDMTLVEFNSAPPSGHRVFWAGWDRGGGNPGSAIAIHHPQTDEKRISFENQGLTTTSYLSNSAPGDGTHLRVIDWDVGTTEPGSSGSPLFNSSKRIVGQLHGGFAACGNNDSDWYGRVSTSWTGGGSNSTRLSNWLDPGSTGATTLNGTQQPTGSTPAAPTNLTAAPQSPSQVLLNWQDNANNESEYRIEVRPPGGGFGDIGSVPANSNGAIVTGLASGTTYQFRVRARNASGNSAYSNTASATTPTNTGPCVADADTMCFNGGRFRVEMIWQFPNGQSGTGKVVPLTDNSGAFYFLNASNLEMLIKVLNACSIGNRFWVFFAATTNVQFTVTVTDTQTGNVKSYFNPQGTAALPVQDTNAFATCP